MVFTFLKAKGLNVGTSLVEDDFVDTAKEVLAKAEKLGVEVLDFDQFLERLEVHGGSIDGGTA